MDKNNDRQVLIIHDKIFNSFKHSKIKKTQQQMLETMSMKITVLEKLGKFEEKIRNCNNIVNLFRSSNNVSIHLKMQDIMFEKANTLNQMGKLQKEIKVYNDIINWFISSDALCIKIRIIKAMRNKISILQRVGSMEEAINVCNKAIDFCGELDNDKIRIDLMTKKAYLFLDQENYNVYTQIYIDILEKYFHSEDIEIRRKIIRLMYIKAQEEGMLDEKINILKEILDAFEKDTDAEIIEPVTNTILVLGNALGKKNDRHEAINVFSTAKKYLNYDDNDIQYNVALSLNNIIVGYELLCEKENEIRAYEDFISIFKMSKNEEIKSLVSDAEAELVEKKKLFELQQSLGSNRIET
jgi:tetratricopeptide (TPR) repeat protein